MPYQIAKVTIAQHISNMTHSLTIRLEMPDGTLMNWPQSVVDQLATFDKRWKEQYGQGALLDSDFLMEMAQRMCEIEAAIKDHSDSLKPKKTAVAQITVADSPLMGEHTDFIQNKLAQHFEEFAKAEEHNILYGGAVGGGKTPEGFLSSMTVAKKVAAEMSLGAMMKAVAHLPPPDPVKKYISVLDAGEKYMGYPYFQKDLWTVQDHQLLPSGPFVMPLGYLATDSCVLWKRKIAGGFAHRPISSTFNLSWEKLPEGYLFATDPNIPSPGDVIECRKYMTDIARFYRVMATWGSGHPYNIQLEKLQPEEGQSFKSMLNSQAPGPSVMGVHTATHPLKQGETYEFGGLQMKVLDKAGLFGPSMKVDGVLGVAMVEKPTGPIQVVVLKDKSQAGGKPIKPEDQDFDPGCNLCDDPNCDGNHPG
jgi:hypothetical protein